MQRKTNRAKVSRRKYHYSSETCINLDDYRKPLSTGSYIVFDLETTGGNPERNSITEICAFKYVSGQIAGRFYTLVNPKRNIPPIVRRMTGITNQMVRHAPPIEAVFEDFLRFIGDDILVSHNTVGDLTFLVHFAKHVCRHKLTNYFLCTHRLSERLINDSPNYSLSGLGDHLQLSNSEPLHRAEADAQLTLRLFKVLMDRITKRGITKIIDTIRFQGHLETNLRLGLAFDERSIANAPTSTGTFALKDFDGKILFVSSSQNVRRDLHKLKRFDSFPKKLLRTVLQCYHVQTTAYTNLYRAMLDEVDIHSKFGCKVAPHMWHGRQIQLLNLIREGSEMIISIGPYTGENITEAYGPVTEQKLAEAKIRKLAEILEGKVGRRGLRVPHGKHRIITNLFTQKVDEVTARYKRERFKLSTLLNFKKLRRLNRDIALYGEIKKLQLLDSYKFLSSFNGVISVPHNAEGDRELYPVADAYPKKPKIVAKGNDNLRSPELAAWLQASLQNVEAKRQALKINATLWMILIGSKRRNVNCRFTEIERVCVKSSQSRD